MRALTSLNVPIGRAALQVRACRSDLREDEGRENARRNIAGSALVAPVGMVEAQPRQGQAELPAGGEPLVVQPIARRPAPGRALGLTVTSPWTKSGAFGADTIIRHLRRCQ